MQRLYTLIISWNTRNSIPLFYVRITHSRTYFLFLFFLSHSEAHFFFIWPFWVALKRIFSSFGLSESLRSVFFLHLAFLSRSEAYFFSIWSFWVAQKRIFSPFGLSESLRSLTLLFLASDCVILWKQSTSKSILSPISEKSSHKFSYQLKNSYICKPVRKRGN